MNHLARVLISQDGDVEDRDWCIIAGGVDAARILCTGEVFGVAEGLQIS